MALPKLDGTDTVTETSGGASLSSTSKEPILTQEHLIKSVMQPPDHDQDDNDSLSLGNGYGATLKEEDDVEKEKDYSENIQCNARNFAMEHRIFLKSALSLLAEREKDDSIAINIDDPNTLKAGPLKKATHLVKGAWKFKYVELRRGMFSYYEDAMTNGHLQRKNIRLNAEQCVCRAVKLNKQARPGQAVFELTVDGGPRRFWMTHSKEERAAWIRAIHDAMIGSSNISRGDSTTDHRGRSGKVSKRSPYKQDLDRYLRIQKELKQGQTKQAYVTPLGMLVGKEINVPVQWLTEQQTDDENFKEDNVSKGVDQLWKDLARDSLQINGDKFLGGSGHAVERIVGALVRKIMQFDRSSPLRENSTASGLASITEVQAIAFARDVLLSGNRTRSGGDSYFVVDALCRNSALIVLVPSSLEAEPVSVNISHAMLEKGTSLSGTYSLNDRSGWMKTRFRTQKEWRKNYFILSEGTLTFYEKSHPRPHGALGQIKIADAHINVSQRSGSRSMRRRKGRAKDKKDSPSLYVLSIKLDAITEKQILFEDPDTFILWASAFESAITKKIASDTPAHQEGKKKRFLRGLLDEEHREARRGFTLGANSLRDHAALLGFQEETIVAKATELAFQHSCKASPTVRVSVSASTVYNICTLDPQGVESEDTWASIRATFNQDFCLTGGPNARMTTGEEIVRVNVVKCCDYNADAQNAYWNPESGLSPRALAGQIGRRMRRSTSIPTSPVNNVPNGQVTIDVS